MPTDKTAEWRLVTLMYLNDHLKILQHDKLQPQGSIHWMYSQITQYDIENLHPQVKYDKQNTQVNWEKKVFTYLHYLNSQSSLIYSPKITPNILNKHDKNFGSISQVRSVNGTFSRNNRALCQGRIRLIYVPKTIPRLKCALSMAHSLGTIERSASDAFTWLIIPSLRL